METPGLEGEVFNVGNDEPVTIEELAQRVKAMTNSPSEIVYIPYERAYGPDFEDIRYRVPDITKLRRAIGYEPTVPLDEILRRVIDYERERFGKTFSPV